MTSSVTCYIGMSHTALAHVYGIGDTHATLNIRGAKHAAALDAYMRRAILSHAKSIASIASITSFGASFHGIVPFATSQRNIFLTMTIFRHGKIGYQSAQA
ncbi:hypothetical protein K402DRAFT_186357 [Aulographum hederae CBS 113979]|uniref:Uncharacterized protein n=1 Tax=Aulographum hederae CBS 113979 TaxID=1176131 RepID=A0A6G1GPD0_9PEZI|nr:hypothetical protein K402DRAFT_186357 [Aulographum hederae CBS 113979]